MKKTFTILSILVLANFGYAQKQTSGAQTIEMEFSPLGSEPLKISSLRYRFFKSESLAYRMALFVGGKSSATFGDTAGGAAQTKSTSSNLDFSVRPGVEFHFSGTSRLSPYYGAELFLGVKNTKNNDQTNWAGDNRLIETMKTKTSKSTVGLNVLMGTDFYVTENLYLGAEIGFGFLSEGLGKTKVRYENPEDPASKDTESKGDVRQTSWGPNYQGTIRLGWRFK